MQFLSQPHQRLCPHLHRLTRKSADFQQGPIPDDALRAFHLIRNALISEPVVAFPRADRKFALISEPQLPSECQERCLSASLCQIDEQGAFHVLSHASSQFRDHEANYLLFLTDMANALRGMDAFDQYIWANLSSSTWTNNGSPIYHISIRRRMHVSKLRPSSTTSSSKTKPGPEYRFISAPLRQSKSTSWAHPIQNSFKPKLKIYICSSSSNSGYPNFGPRHCIRTTNSNSRTSIATC